MKTIQSMLVFSLIAIVIVIGSPVLAADMEGMMKKGEAVKGHAKELKKEAGETKDSAKKMQAKDAMSNAGEAQDAGKKLKDAITK
ncbi:MAG: hypothetical protein HZB35_01145 [Nitrospirae bacterium]|nr:hypothetical protein [Nitrospirota bacterium]